MFETIGDGGDRVYRAGYGHTRTPQAKTKVSMVRLGSPRARVMQLWAIILS